MVENDSPATLRHSVCRWCHADIPLESLCLAAKEIGLSSIELLMPADLPVLHKYGLQCAMVSFPTGTTPAGVEVGGITSAFNRPEHHDTLVSIYEAHLQAAAKHGAKQVICFSGNRDGMNDEEGIQHCASGIRRLLPLAESLGITLVMELLNSKIDHPGYMCDHTEWGVRLCETIGSGHFKLLYDIYHMQIMEGDVIATIRKHHRHIAHYHTGGVPGRNEIDATQELNYPAIMRAIAETGYRGYIGQEFIPKRPGDLTSLAHCVGLCRI